MATSSISETIRIRDALKLKKLLNALDRSSKKQGRETVYSRPCSDMTKEQMKKYFGGSDDGVQDRQTE